MSPLRRVLAELRPEPGRVALAVLTGVAATAAAIGLLGTSGWLISRAAQQPPVLFLMVAVVTVRALGIGRGVLRYAERLAGHDVALRGVVTLRESLYRRLAAADPGTVARLRRGDLLARVGADVDTVADVVVRGLLPCLVAAVTGLATVLTLTAILPLAGAALAAGLLLGGVAAPVLAGRAAARALREAEAERVAVSEELVALFDGLAELIVAGAVADRQARLAAADARLSRRLDAAARPAALAAALSTASTGLAIVACLWLGVRAVAAGDLAPVMLAVVTLVPLAAAEVVAPLPGAAAVLVRARAAADRLVALLDVPAAPVERVETGAPGRVRIRARGLVCGHDGVPVAPAMDLDLAPGARLVLAGPSGGGKTTLLMTLAGLLQPLGGLLDPAGGELRRAVTFVADDAHVFGTTLRENLRIADPGADDAVLTAALRRAGLGHWPGDLPDGLDTLLDNGSGSGGRPISGGERRRLLLARAVLSPAPVVLLDEPAEHLDPATADRLLADALAADGPFAGRTVVVATHRPAPVDTPLLVLGGALV